MTEQIEYWRNLAEEDIGAAADLLESGRYMFVLFFCQQAVEMMLKALVNEKTGEIPPRTHNLSLLARRAEIQGNEQQSLFLAELNTYYIQSRYPQKISQIGATINKVKASEVLTQTKELLEWLKFLLKS